MAISSVSDSTWTSVVTTTKDTVFQNRSVNAMYITTESTAGLDFDKGFYLAPDQAIIIGPSKDVSAVTFRNAGDLFYMQVV